MRKFDIDEDSFFVNWQSEVNINQKKIYQI